MRIALIGQQDFGKAVLEAFLQRGDEVAAVFCAPEKGGAKPDVLSIAAQEKGLKLFRFESLALPRPPSTVGVRAMYLRAGLRGGVTGAASAGLLYGANSLTRDWNAVGRIAARSTASGLAAEINGGDFQDGLRLGFTTSTTSWAYRQVVGYDATWRQGGSAVPKESLSYPVEGANNIGTVTQEVRSNAWWSEGGIVSRALNVVPGVNAVAGMHDVFQIKLEQWGGGLSRNVLNIPGMPIAAYLTGGALTDELLPLAYANGFRAR